MTVWKQTMWRDKMTELPECLQPAVEQLKSYEIQISDLESRNENLDEDLRVLNGEKEALQQQIQEESEAHALAVQTYEKEKLTLRELNIVVSDQLREKVAALNALQDASTELEAENGAFKNLNDELAQQNSQVSSESMLAATQQEELAQQTESLNNEVEELRRQNAALKEENSALTLVNSAMHQRQSEAPLQETRSNDASPELEEEIKRLKQELHAYKTENKDESFLISENQRLTQRHGEITQEKMQASARMHAAEEALRTKVSELEQATATVNQLEFEQQGLQNLYKNLSIEKERLATLNAGLIDEKAGLDEQATHLSEQLQNLIAEKERIAQELSQEHTRTDVLTEEVNHLRLKSRTLAEEIKVLKEGLLLKPKENLEPQVEALEIDMSETDSQEEHPQIEIISPSGKTSPHFPGE
jgi:chromosome segregation ATPase